MKVAPDYDGERFFTRVDGVRMATPLLVVILLIGVVDVIFAVDSIPAIFAITTDPFIVLTSNVFAILGLRAMYFLLAGMHERFHLLTYGLALVLVLHRREDAADRRLQDPGRLVAGRHGRGAGRHHAAVAEDPAQGRREQACRRRVPVQVEEAPPGRAESLRAAEVTEQVGLIEAMSAETADATRRINRRSLGTSGRRLPIVTHPAASAARLSATFMASKPFLVAPSNDFLNRGTSIPENNSPCSNWMPPSGRDAILK